MNVLKSKDIIDCKLNNDLCPLYYINSDAVYKYVSCTALCAGIIDDPDNSLFSYEEGKSWADYFDPDFTPAYQPTFTHPALEERAMEICGDDQFCVFDIAATEREEVGMSTMQGNLDLEMITELSQPGQCIRVCIRVCVYTCACVCVLACVQCLYACVSTFKVTHMHIYVPAYTYMCVMKLYAIRRKSHCKTVAIFLLIIILHPCSCLQPTVCQWYWCLCGQQHMQLCSWVLWGRVL